MIVGKDESHWGGKVTGSISNPWASGLRKLRLSPSVGLLIAALVSGLVLISAPLPMTRAAAGSAALTFCFLIFGLKARQWLMERDLSQHTKALRCVIGKDPVPCLLTDEQGQILYQNKPSQLTLASCRAHCLFLHTTNPGAYRVEPEVL